MKPAFIRSAQRADLPVLRLVELAAADRFTESDLPPSLQRQTLDPDELQDALDQGLLWVVECQKELVGFLATRVEDCCVHVLEMSVIPSHGRQGLGTSLLDAAAREARRRSLSGVTLTVSVRPSHLDAAMLEFRSQACSGTAAVRAAPRPAA